MPSEFAHPGAADDAELLHYAARVVDTAALRDMLGHRDVVRPRGGEAHRAVLLVDNSTASVAGEETALQDPFDYEAEDKLAAVAAVPQTSTSATRSCRALEVARPTGTWNPRADTRI
ncbi:MAG: hypothetical protein U0W40_06520 [Acidimicrobiia bacterium]